MKSPTLSPLSSPHLYLSILPRPHSSSSLLSCEFCRIDVPFWANSRC